MSLSSPAQAPRPWHDHLRKNEEPEAPYRTRYAGESSGKSKGIRRRLVFNPGQCDIDKEIKALTDGYGCDIYIEATGNPASVRQGLTVIRKLGTFVEFSVFGSETTVRLVHHRRPQGARHQRFSPQPYAYPFVIENMMKGNIKTNGVVSRIFKLEDWEKAFEYATGKYGDFKVAFTFD